MEAKKIIGGPEKKAIGRDKVLPVNFSEEDPFHDVGLKMHNLERDIRRGLVKDLVIISRYEGTVNAYWRGDNPMTTALGMLDYAKTIIVRDQEE